MKPVLIFLENPFNCDILSTSVSVSNLQLVVERAVFEEQLIELQHNSVYKGRHKEQSADMDFFHSKRKS